MKRNLVVSNAIVSYIQTNTTSPKALNWSKCSQSTILSSFIKSIFSFISHFRIHTQRQILFSISQPFNHLVRYIGPFFLIRLYVNTISFSFCCFTVLVLCRLAVLAYRWMLQHPTLSCPAGVVVLWLEVPVHIWLTFPFTFIKIRVFLRLRQGLRYMPMKDL
jgi:hypothetical protein